MERRLKTNLVLLAALALVGAVIVFAPEPREQSSGFSLFAEDTPITRIVVERGGETRLALRKEGGEWRLRHPVDLPADTFQVDALIDALREPAARRYSLQDASADALGLTNPEWRVEVNGEPLDVGGRTAVGNRRYLRKGEYVYLVNDLLSYRLERDAFDYAGRRLLPADATIEAIRLPDGQRIERAGNGWSIAGSNAAVSADALQGLVDAWRNATAMNVTAANSVPRDGEVVLEFAGGEVLRFGIEMAGGSLKLTRNDPAVTYHLPSGAAPDLLQLTAEPQSPGTERE